MVASKRSRSSSFSVLLPLAFLGFQSGGSWGGGLPFHSSRVAYLCFSLSPIRVLFGWCRVASFLRSSSRTLSSSLMRWAGFLPTGAA